MWLHGLLLVFYDATHICLQMLLQQTIGLGNANLIYIRRKTLSRTWDLMLTYFILIEELDRPFVSLWSSGTDEGFSDSEACNEIKTEEVWTLDQDVAHYVCWSEALSRGGGRGSYIGIYQSYTRVEGVYLLISSHASRAKGYAHVSWCKSFCPQPVYRHSFGRPSHLDYIQFVDPVSSSSWVAFNCPLPWIPRCLWYKEVQSSFIMSCAMWFDVSPSKTIE